MRRDSIPFSQIMPLIDLALLVVLVFVPITLTALRLYQASKGSERVHLHSGEFEVDLPRDQIVPLAIRSATVPRAHLIMAVNLPGSLIQWLISLPASGHASWHPSALALETWQALVFPFFSLPFWWLVGCGLDVIFRKAPLHWSLQLIGTVLFVLCLTVVVASCFPMSASDRADLTLFIRGSLAWTIAFAILPIAWILQTLRRRAEHASTPACS